MVALTGQTQNILIELSLKTSSNAVPDYNKDNRTLFVSVRASDELSIQRCVNVCFY